MFQNGFQLQALRHMTLFTFKLDFFKYVFTQISSLKRKYFIEMNSKKLLFKKYYPKFFSIAARPNSYCWWRGSLFQWVTIYRCPGQRIQQLCHRIWWAWSLSLSLVLLLHGLTVSCPQKMYGIFFFFWVQCYIHTKLVP